MDNRFKTLSLKGWPPWDTPSVPSCPRVSQHLSHKGVDKLSRYNQILSKKPVEKVNIPALNVDPRPELSDDSELWVMLLTLAQQHTGDLQFWGTLQGFRCLGTRIRQITGGSLALRPHIGPDGFDDSTEYEKLRDRWLKPYKGQLIDLMKMLRLEAEKKGIRVG